MSTSIKVIISILLVLWLTGQMAHSQNLPDKILGYRVHKTKLDISLRGPNDPKVPHNSHLLITVNRPAILRAGISGVRMAVSGQVETFGHEGFIDRIMFRDFTINGVLVEIDEYVHGFRLSKKSPFRLSKPVVVDASTIAIARAIGKGVESQENWTISGTALVFGKFNRLGFTFKRVIPVKINAVIRNPLLD